MENINTSFWSRQPGIAIKGYIGIYGMAILSAFIVSNWMKISPIGPDKLYYFDTWCWNLCAVWWLFVFAAAGNWPFAAIKGTFTRGVIYVLSCWVLGYLTYGGIYWSGLDISWVFPIICTIFALLVFFCYTGENWLWADRPPKQQLFCILVTVIGLTWPVVYTGIKWIPCEWFPFCQIFLATGLGSYLFRGMKQPAKTIAMWGTWFILIWAMTQISISLGIWDPKAAGFGIWQFGNYNDIWLLFFFVYCAFVYGILIPAHNWPFTKIPMPWGGIIAGAFVTVLCIVITKIILAMIPSVFSDIQEAQTYGYLAVSWSFFIPMCFGVGFEKVVHWAGQKTPGTWEDCDDKVLTEGDGIAM